MKKKFRRALAIMLALLMIGSVFTDYYINVRADEEENTSDSQDQTDAGTEDGFTITSDLQEQEETEMEDEFTISSDLQNQTETETEDEFTLTSDLQDQTDTGTKDELIMTFDSQDQTDAGTEDGLAIAADSQEHTDGVTITSAEVRRAGEQQPLGDGDDVHSGEVITIVLLWELDHEKRIPDGTEFTDQEFVLDVTDLNLKGIELPDTSQKDLHFRTDSGLDKVVGYYYLSEGKIHIVFTDGDYYQGTTDRNGGLSFSGTIENYKDVKEDETEKKVGIGESAVTLDYYLTDTESFASVNKSTVDGLDAKEVNGEMKYYQKYKVTVTAQHGTVHHIDLQDNPTTPDSLTNPTDVRIVINRAGDSSQEQSFNSLDAALAYIKAIDNLYMGESIDIYYTMEVSADIFNQDVWYGNKVSGEYISNRSEEPKPTNESSAWIDGNISENEPEINKVGLKYEVGADGKGYVIWKIIIKLNELYDETKPNLQDYIDKVVDIPGSGFQFAEDEKTLYLSKFHNEGNGVYTYEYKMEVTDEVLNSPVDVNLSNEVKVYFKDKDEPYDKVGHFTFKEHTHASIVKTLAGHERKKDGMYVTWNIEVSDIPVGVKGFTITDKAAPWSPNPGNQGLLTQIRLSDSSGLKDVLVVDGVGIIKKTDIIASVNFSTYDERYVNSTIVFQDKYIDGIAKADGSITIQVQTLITEDTIGKEYGNVAQVSYQDSKTGSGWTSPESRANFHDQKNLLTKTGEVIAGKNAIKYTIKVLLPVLEITKSGGHFIITDKLPEELSVDIEDTDTITVQLTDIWGGNVRVQDSDMKYTPTLEEQTLTVDITATDNFVEQIQGYPGGTSDGYYLVVNVTAEVEDLKKFLEECNEGETVSLKLENTASGTYAEDPIDEGTSIGEATAENELKLAQMVEKKGEYDADLAPYAKYTVHVNKEGVTFGVDRLEAVDQLDSGSALTFVDDDKHPVMVYEVYGPNDWDRYEALDADDFDYTISGNKLEFTKLPDGKHLRIEYWASVDYVNVDTLNEENSSNHFELQGFNAAQTKDGFYFNSGTFTPSGWAESRVGSITLYKFWWDGNKQVALDGSVFRLKKVKIEDGNLIDDVTDGSAVIKDRIEIPDGNNGKIRFNDLPVNQIFVLEEIEAGEGFSLGAPYYFIVDRTTTIDREIVQKYNIQYLASGATLEYENKLTKPAWIQIAKTWEETDTKKLSWDEIKGSLSFEIKNEQGETIQTLTGEKLHIDESDGTTRYVSDKISVAPGTYTVVETNTAIEDFEVQTTYIVEVGDKKPSGSGDTTDAISLQTAGEIVTVVYTNTYNYTGTFPVKVSKRSLTGENEIKGARFRLSGGTLGTDVEFLISGEVLPYELKLKPGDYILTETQAPRGFKRATDAIEFTVGNNGEITLKSGSETADKVGNDTVVMRDEPLDVEVRKIAVVGEDTIGVVGAMLALYDKGDLDNDYNPHPDHEALYEWPSTGESKQIGPYLYAGDKRTYVLVETKVPESGGYGYSKKIEFKVDENGDIYDVKYVGGSEVDTESTTNDPTDNKNRILMEDKAISIKLSKVDRHGNTITGRAVISVYKKADIDEATGNPLPGAVAIETFTFDNSSEPHEFGTELQPGERYVFIEEETGVPAGYQRAAYIEFEVEEDGTVRVYDDVDFDRTRDAYLMYDAEDGEELASLVIYKTVSGDLTLDEINGALKFHVEKVSGDGDAYDKIFTIKPHFVKENGKYVLRLPNRSLGTYKVTEIYEGTTPGDMKLEVSYTIDSGLEQKDSSPNNKDFATGNIELTTGGEQHTVTFNNNYQYKMGTIKLTKSLEFVGSELDWDKIAGKLNFHIYKVINPGGGTNESKVEIKDSPISGSLLEWNETDQVYELEKPVPVGTYIVEEKYVSIDGYVMTTTHTVKVGATSTSETGYETPKREINEDGTLEVGYNNKYVQTHPVVISKRAVTNGAELANATWKITGENLDGMPITSIQWTTKEDTAAGRVEPHEVALEPGEYTLTEVKAPKGYKKADPITFKLDGNGNITIISDQTNALDGNTVILWDDPLDVEVDKVTLGGGAEVKGATLCLYDDKGNKLDEHVSDGNVWRIGEYLQLGGTYKLVEELAPNGYGYSADIEFTVGDDGNIKDVTAGSTQGNKILMEDRPISIKLNKVELGTTKELEGAVIGIYYADDVDVNGRLKDPNTKPLETWKSEGGCHEFGAKLEAGRDYVFIETVAPDGYQFATSIRFTINKDGSVKKVSTVAGDTDTVKTTRDGGDTVYLMEDAVYTGPRATLVLTKSGEGEGINPADITKTNLRFHVESIDLTPAYDQVFYAGGAGFEQNGRKYVQYIYNLIPGTYKITELWDDSPASGIVCTGQTWEMILTGASGAGSPSGTGVTTGEFNLDDGDTIEVNYTNTYENGGTLIITKTIAGDVTKEAVEGTVTFTVTDNSTNKKDTYTLKDDFEYNSKTKQWTKELALTAGGYTIEESVKTPDGKTCTTSYTVTGGTLRNDTGTKVSNVVLEEGDTITVAYTNTYAGSTDNEDNSDDGGNDKGGGSDKGGSNDKGGGNGKGNGDSKNSSKSNVKSKDNGKENSDDSFVVTKIVKNAAASLTKTGDNAPIGAWLLLMVFGVAGLAAGGYALRRRKKKGSTKISADGLEWIQIK